MTNNENEFEHEGKVYVAIDSSSCETNDVCGECAFSCKDPESTNYEGCDMPLDDDYVECDGFKRQDKIDVIFKEKV